MRRILLLVMALIAGCSLKERASDDPALSLPSTPLRAIPRVVESPKSVDLANAYFDYDKAILRSEAKKALRADAEWIKKHPQATVQVEGYCDETGSYEYNLALGQRRADAAKSYLKGLGVADSRVEAVGVGRIPGAGDDTRARNRRAGFIVLFQ
ncbi:MAG: OmpA family protein [Deltaproteobacteria bacterium]|nr:OmpA family protein [Deltaproteobacteria bacterium]MBI3294404.1 OmpA family protein [Deltaproteobacteria bacterium]